MKNILILTPFYGNPGGAETFTADLIKEAKKCNRVTLLTFQPFDRQLESFVQAGNVKIYRMNWWIKQSKAWSGLSLKNIFSVIPQMVFASLSMCIKRRFDIVHGQGLLSGFVAVLLKRIFKVKAYVTLLALYDFKAWKGIRKAAVRFILNNCDIIFVEGENGKNDLEGLCDERIHGRIRIFQHWCDHDLFKPPDNRPNDKIRVLFVGRPIREKGKHIIEEAEKILNNPKYEFTYVENVSQQELAEFYKMAHICVVPSLYSEGYSRVVAESASCGCFVITSHNGSLPEMVKEFGISRSADGKNFADAIFNAVYFEEINKNHSYEYAKEHFSPKNAETFLNEYN